MSTKTKTKTKVGLAVLVTDRSGSMIAIKEEAQGSYQTYIDGQRTLSDETPDLDVNVMLIEFDDHYDHVYGPVDVTEVPDWTLEPRGMTALYDAIGKGINDADDARKKLGVKNDAVSLIIITDGKENASKEFHVRHGGQEQIKKLVEKKKAKGWDIQFLAGDLDSVKLGEAIGVATVGWSPQIAGQNEYVMRGATGQSMSYLASGTSSAGRYDDKESDDSK